MPLHLSLNDEADELLSRDPFALLTGMLLDQQFPMERAFAGPYLLATRLGLSELDPQVLVSTTEERLLEAAKGPPAIHRYPGSMAKRVQALAEVVLSEYDGDAARIWQDAPDGKDALARLESLPGFGSAKARIFLAVQLYAYQLLAWLRMIARVVVGGASRDDSSSLYAITVG